MIKSVPRTQQEQKRIDFPKDASLPGMKSLLSADVISSLIRDRWASTGKILLDCKVEYVRYKPATNCLATYRIMFAAAKDAVPEEAVIWGKAYTGVDFEVAAGKSRSRTKRLAIALNEPIMIESANLLIDDIANDQQLGGLQTIFDSRKLRRILYELVPSYPATQFRISHKRLNTRVIRFKPEKRAVIRITTTATHLESDEKHNLVLYLRCYCDDRGAAIFSVMNKLVDSLPRDGRVNVPVPYAYLKNKQMLIVAGVDGTPFLDDLASDNRNATLERVSAALRDLHASNTAALPTRGPAEMLMDLRSTSTALKTVLPERTTTIDRLQYALEAGLRYSNARIGFVHGDFHHGQVLMQPEKVILLDFDRCYLGDTLADIGNFCAHLRILEIENRLSNSIEAANTFISAYERASGQPVDRSDLRCWTALGLLLRAIHPFRSLQPSWRMQIASILDLCEQCLV